MPRIRVNGAERYYEEQGSGPETIFFSHGLLWSGRMFDEQIAMLKERYRCVAFDHRGQGQSEVTRDGYDMETLYEDAAALIEALGGAPCHFLGLSMGGFIGLRLAARRPELLKSLLLLETSAGPEPPENQARYRQLNFIVRWVSLGLVGDRENQRSNVNYRWRAGRGNPSPQCTAPPRGHSRLTAGDHTQSGPYLDGRGASRGECRD